MAATVKAKREYAVLRRVTAGGRQVLTVRLTVGKAVDLYTVTVDGDRVDWSHLTQGDRDYTCTVRGGRAVACTCPSRKPCKHIGCTAELIRTGRIVIGN